MYVKVLGPLDVRHDGVLAVPSAPKPRKVMALLLMNPSRVVPVSSIISELWGDQPPRSALTTIQTYILKLRKLLATATGSTLGEVADSLLRTSGNGYRLFVETDDFDLYRYQHLEEAAVGSLADGDLKSGGRFLRDALSLWTGPALMNVEQGRLLEAEVAKLEQSKLTMIEHRVEIELRLGRHREILSDLMSLVAKYRFHEDLHAQYVVALYRSGQRTMALETFHKLRENMVDELGLDPSPKLQRLVNGVLSCDATLDDISVVPLPNVGHHSLHSNSII
jgi:DNA-binding SARP family transcriptional activator